MASQTTKAKMTLYQFPGYRSFKPLWLIYELGVQDDIKLVRLDTINDKDTEEYKEYVKSVHPHGTIPALVVEGEGVILESTAICLYLADLYGKLAPAPAHRREYYDWALYGSLPIDNIMEVAYYQWGVTDPKPDPEGLAKVTKTSEICMKRLTKTLEGRDYVCGDSFTAADCIVGFPVWQLGEDWANKGSLLKDFPDVQAYVKRLVDRPAFKAAIKAEGE